MEATRKATMRPGTREKHVCPQKMLEVENEEM